MRFDIALQREHVAVPVDDAGRGRDQCGDAGQFRLEIARGIAADQFEALDAVGLPCAWIASIRVRSASLVATINLPQRRCGTPWLSQKS